jgi:peptidoglycan/LPS O-acetylase OafA/YrhL
VGLQYRTLNHWRGVAALWVVLFHGFGTTYDVTTHPITEILKPIAAPGWLGVHLFFVISGYCIAAATLRLATSGGTVREFVLSRLLRIMPTYWAAFVATLLLSLVALPFNNATLLSTLPDGWRGWTGNLLLIQPYVGTPYYVIVYWSLVVEAGFYIIVALLFTVSRRSPTLAWALAATLTAASVLAPADPRFAVFKFWPEFVCGALVLLALHARLERRPTHEFAFVGVILLLGGCGAALSWAGAESQLWFGAVFALLLLAIQPLDAWLSSARHLRWLATVGTFSYCLYLIHIPFGGRVLGLGRRFVPDTSLLFVALQVGYWTASIGAALVLYRLAESRFEIQRRRFQPSHASASVVVGPV